MARSASQAARVRDLIHRAYVDPAVAVAALPSERVLARELGVARGTVRAALHQLESEGVLRSTGGSGNVVVPHISKSFGLTSFTQDMSSRGWSSRSEVLEAAVEAASIQTAHELGIPTGSPYVRLRRLRLADEVPFAIELVHLPDHVVPGLLSHDLSGSLYGILSEAYGIRIQRHERTVSAVNLDAQHADLLGVPEGSATLYAVQTGYDQAGRRIEFGRSLYRGDRFDFTTMSVAGGPG
ncbi:MAG TPA: GntR family transcriptional regulator [Propionibacteriaceae bacterium]|nr:GntR family transcriptional regulator [Propionibacteriaceae bacterium]HPZ49469.1 GntR family transcriptional regulator [Propionibacteriaceae bacterium]HQE32192.1 GntR family transcriptional regulator [Propionibacteriaceae bacterium]